MTEEIVTSKQSESAGQSRALGLFLLERYDEAADYYDELLQQNPENMSFWENRMICQAEYIPVSESFISQMKLKSSLLSSQGNLCLANALYKLGRNDEALEFTDNVLKQNPDNVDAALMKASLLRESGQDEILYDFMRSLYPRLKKDDRILCLTANYVAAFGNERQAFWMLRKALKINRPAVLQNDLFYQTLLSVEKVDEALDYALDAVTASDKNIIPWKILSKVAGMTEKYDIADDAYTFLSGNGGLSEEQRLEWADVLQKLGKYDEAFNLMIDMAYDSDEWLKQLWQLFQSMQSNGQIKKCREKVNILLEKITPTEGIRFVCDFILQNDRKEAFPLSIIRLLGNENAPNMYEVLEHPSYHGPLILENMLNRLGVSIGKSLNVLDLGCGVGNMAFMLEKYSRPSGSLEGTDASISVLNYAVGLDKYDTLNENDIVSFCKKKENEKKYDLIVCMNVFQYFSDLLPAFRAVKKALAPDGIFVFSILPLTDSGKQFEFQSSGWFYHRSDYALECLKEAGLNELEQSEEVLFRFDQEEVPCCLFAAQKKK